MPTAFRRVIIPIPNKPLQKIHLKSSSHLPRIISHQQKLGIQQRVPSILHVKERIHCEPQHEEKPNWRPAVNLIVNRVHFRGLVVSICCLGTLGGQNSLFQENIGFKLELGFRLNHGL